MAQKLKFVFIISSHRRLSFWGGDAEAWCSGRGFGPSICQFQLPQLFGVVGFLSQDDLISVFSCLALLMLGLLGLSFGRLQNFILQFFQTST